MHIDGPFLARLAQVTGDAALFDAAADQVLSYARVLQDPDGLFRHGWEASCGANGELWARGNGWALTGMLDTLAALPAGNPARAEICDRIIQLLRALESRQAADGLWHTVITDHATYTEATLAAMLSVALREAARCGAIDTRPYDRMRASAEQAVLQQRERGWRTGPDVRSHAGLRNTASMQRGASACSLGARVRWFCCYVISYRHKANENRQN